MSKQFSTSTQFSFIRPVDKTLSGAKTPDLNGPKSDGSKGIFCIPESYSITGASLSDRLASYLGRLLGESFPTAETQSVYSTATADWTITV